MLNTSAHAAAFEPLRSKLVGLAYRMLGSCAEAEDVAQDAFVRFQAVDLSEVAEPGAYLHKTVARLCLDRLRSARTRRESYVGTWLPEPIVEEWTGGPDEALSIADDLSFALMLTLERLSPPERTAFLLHDVFGMDFEGIAQVLERSSPACRKLAERARTQVQDGQPRFTTKPEDEARLCEAFMLASASGDVGALGQLLAQDAVAYTDGGGKRKAALNPICGRDRIVRFIIGVQGRADSVQPERVVPRRVNQLPGWLLQYSNGELAVAALETRDGLIARIYIVRNPDKLRHIVGA